jgi:DNA mismatch endonuclease (patch repair protein)
MKAYRLAGWRRHQSIFGKPDFVFSKAKLAVFVDGCFWHGCPKCYRAPKSNIEYWKLKILGNRNRDLKVNRLLRAKGWKILRFWECDLSGSAKVISKLNRALGRTERKGGTH